MGGETELDAGHSVLCHSEIVGLAQCNGLIIDICLNSGEISDNAPL